MPRATQDTTRLQSSVVYGVFTLYDRLFPRRSTLTLSCHVVVLQPPCRLDDMGLALPCSLATTYGIIVYFLLLWVLRCFQFPTFASLTGWQAFSLPGCPIRISRINGYLRLPRAFRSLSRPSSPPRAKASTVCPCFFSHLVHTYGLIYLKLALLVSSLLMSNMSKILFPSRDVWRITDSNR